MFDSAVADRAEMSIIREQYNHQFSHAKHLHNIQRKEEDDCLFPQHTE